MKTADTIFLGPVQTLCMSNLIVIWLDYDTAEKQLYFRCGARVEPNSDFTLPRNNSWLLLGVEHTVDVKQQGTKSTKEQ